MGFTNNRFYHEEKMKNKRWYSIIIFIIVITAVIFIVVSNIGDIKRSNIEISITDTLLPMLFVITAYIIQYIIWIKLSESYGLRISKLRAGRAYFSSQLGKYVPGKIGLYLVRSYAYSENSRKGVIVATSVEIISAIGAACVLTAIGVLAEGDIFPVEIVGLSLVVLLLIFLFLYPPVFSKTINAILKRLGKEPLKEIPRYRQSIRYLFLYAIPALVHGLGFFILIRSFAEIGFDLYPVITSAYYAAGLMGLLAFFAPAGIGVREGVLMLILPYFIPTAVVIVSVIVMRLIVTAVEICMALSFEIAYRCFWDHRHNRGNENEK
jgi:uncharacterized membrane protein YbhN (UPF0104 family)